MKIINLVSLYIFVFVSLAACSSLRSPEGSLLGDGRVNPASANQMFDKRFESFTDEQLILLLDPDGLKQEGKTYTYTKEFGKLEASQKLKVLRLAFRNANNYKNNKAHRAQIQDRLIAASNQRCNFYTTYLKRLSNRTNGVFGTLTTVLGGASAIVTGDTAARTLGGLAGITSGTRAELNQAIFESVATSVIVPAIQSRRKMVLANILKKRTKELSDYTIEAAIADAITYHGACSMDAGINQAGRSIQAFDNVGIEYFTETQKELGAEVKKEKK